MAQPLSDADQSGTAGPTAGWQDQDSIQVGFLHVAAFARVVDAGSFTVAARQMHVSKATISKRVAHLESLLGASLLTRTTRSLRVTEQGGRFYSHCRRILDEWAAAESELVEFDRVPRGRLGLRVPSYFGEQRIAPAIQEFLERFPNVDIELSLADGLDRGSDGPEDVGIRIGPMAQPNDLSVFLARCTRRICGSPAYVKRCGMPSATRDLGLHNCLYVASGAGGATWILEGPEGVETVTVNGRFKADSESAIRTATLSGLGLALLPGAFVADDLMAGRLVAVLPRYRDRSHALYMDYGSERGVTPVVRAFVTFVKTYYQSMTVVDAAAAPGSKSHEQYASR